MREKAAPFRSEKPEAASDDESDASSAAGDDEDEASFASTSVSVASTSDPDASHESSMMSLTARELFEGAPSMALYSEACAHYR